MKGKVNFEAEIYNLKNKKQIGTVICYQEAKIYNLKIEVEDEEWKEKLKDFFSSEQEFLIPENGGEEVIKAIPKSSKDLLLTSLTFIDRIGLYSKFKIIDGSEL